MLWFIANLLIRSSLILGAAVLLCRLFPRLRPAQRHLISLAGLGLLFLWPLLAALLPAVNIPFGWRSASGDGVTVRQFVVHGHVAPVAHSFFVSPEIVWAAVAFITLLPLLLAQIRLRVLEGHSQECEDPTWLSLLDELSARLGVAKTPALLIHPDLIMPMVSGVLRPRIVLPCDCDRWTSSRRRIVLLHELAHIARRDLLSQRFARFVTATWWFQPFAWGTLSLLRRESERACDELVIASGVRRSDYAAELLAIAQTFTMDRASLAMARPDGLEIRLQSILQPETNRSTRLVVVSLISLAALTLAVAAVTPSLESQPLSLRGHTMKRTLFAGLLASAGLTAASIGGSLYDPSGAAVPNAKALLYDPDTNAKFETTTAPDGKFAFETLPPGQYILRVQSPGFATLFREFNVKAESKVDRGLTLALGKVKETVNVSAEGTAAPAAVAAPKRLRVGGAVEEANLTTKVQPIYPKAAKTAHVQGTVEFEMVISKEGEPMDIRVLASPSDDLTQSSLEAVRQWRYKPTLLNGSPIEVVTDVIVNYTLLN